MEKGVCFYDIAERVYKNTDQTVNLEDYKKECNKKFRDILRILELQEDYDGLKQTLKKNKDENNEETECMKRITLRFNETDARFLQMLIEEYTGKLKNVRCDKFFEVDDEFAVELVEGFYDLFMTKTDESRAKKIVKSIYQKFEYPNRKLNIEIRKVDKILKQIIGINNEGRNIPLNSEDKLYWLQYVRKDLERKLAHYLALYNRMIDIRYDEINDEAFKELDLMSIEQPMEIEIELDCLDMITNEFLGNEEVKKLKQEEIILLEKESTMKSYKRQLEIRERLKEIYNQIYESYGRENGEEREENNNRKKPKQLVLTALKELKEINIF